MHQLVSPFSRPGEVDLSADVDFLALVDAALGASENVEVHGPVEQGIFLEQLGIKERAEMLIRGFGKGTGKDGRPSGGQNQSEGDKDMTNEEDKEKRARTVRDAVERLVSRLPGRGMGTLYKALAIVPERGGRRPIGFGGGLTM